jgi:hypothetical protein
MLLLKSLFHPSFREWSDHLYCVKVKKGKETRVASMFSSLNQVHKQLFKSLLQELKPDNGPWFEVTQVLQNCDEVFMIQLLLLDRLVCQLIKSHVFLICR